MSAPVAFNTDLAPLLDAIADRVAAKLGERPGHDAYLTVEQAAEYLACKPKRIYELVAAKRLEHHRDGRRLLFKHAQLDAALDVIEVRFTP